MESFLRKNNLILLIKPHPLEHEKFTSEIKESDEIFIYNSIDPYPLLRKSKLLITDYSSICFDYLITRKPIVFFQPDKEGYLSDVGLYFNVDEVFKTVRFLKLPMS